MVHQIKKNADKTKIKADILTVFKKIEKHFRLTEAALKYSMFQKYSCIIWLVRRGVTAYMYF
jgi:hypothetical protein